MVGGCWEGFSSSSFISSSPKPKLDFGAEQGAKIERWKPRCTARLESENLPVTFFRGKYVAGNLHGLRRADQSHQRSGGTPHHQLLLWLDERSLLPDKSGLAMTKRSMRREAFFPRKKLVGKFSGSSPAFQRDFHLFTFTRYSATKRKFRLGETYN